MPPEIKESPRDVAVDCARDMIVVANVRVAKVVLEKIIRHRLVAMRINDNAIVLEHERITRDSHHSRIKFVFCERK